MMKIPVWYFLLIFFICVGAGCANIVPPSGGKKDTTPPKLLSVKPGDSVLNAKVTKIELRYDEYVELKDAKEVQVSPLLQFPPTLVAVGKKVTVTIPDSLLSENTTYRISFGKSIADLHESNPIKPYTYVFSTTNYFDSLQLDGTVINAATGKPDTGVIILLYPATKSDSVVVKEKPMYIGRATGGAFTIAGLPDRPFRIYALKDANDNMVYDGEGEKIGFIDRIVRPADTASSPIMFKVFEEKKTVDTADVDEEVENGRGFKKRKASSKDVFGYGVGVDTTNINKRTLDVTKPLTINLSAEIDSVNKSKMGLSYDSLISDTVTVEIEVPFTVDTDTVKQDMLLINTAWKENKVYTLRLQKGFAKDSTGIEPMPSKHKFRTKSDDDYSKLNVHLPAKYAGSKYVLLVRNDKDTVYKKPVTDTMVHLVKLQPGAYTMFVIEDANENGEWDTGDLFEKRQPENVIPFAEVMQLKPGWDNTFDFVVKEETKPGTKKDSSPKRRDRGLGK